jgi:hypothetical protein
VNFVLLNVIEPVRNLLDHSPAVNDFAFKVNADLHNLGKELSKDFCVGFALRKAAPESMQHCRVTEDNLERCLLLSC